MNFSDAKSNLRNRNPRWKYTIYALIFLLVSVMALFCSDSGRTKQDPAYGLIGGGALPTFTCNSNPTFTELTATNGFDNCQSCHDASGHGGVILTSYNSTKAKTVPGNAQESVLYQVLFGIMAVHTNTAINRATYCWIQGGSNP